MNIVVPDELLRGTRFDSDRAVVDLAIGLYADDRATLGQAAAIAAMSQALFLRELGRLHVPMHYDVEDFAADLAVLEQQRRPARDSVQPTGLEPARYDNVAGGTRGRP